MIGKLITDRRWMDGWMDGKINRWIDTFWICCPIDRYN